MVWQRVKNRSSSKMCNNCSLGLFPPILTGYFSCLVSSLSCSLGWLRESNHIWFHLTAKKIIQIKQLLCDDFWRRMANCFFPSGTNYHRVYLWSGFQSKVTFLQDHSCCAVSSLTLMLFSSLWTLTHIPLISAFLKLNFTIKPVSDILWTVKNVFKNSYKTGA